MTLPSPNLDDRTFGQLMDEARQRIAATCSEWTDLSVGDPGITLVEVFAFLTETLIYRFNRVPDKARVEFLRLLGVMLVPPAAAKVNLSFTLAQPVAKAVEIPRGTRVTVARAGGGGEAPVFATQRAAVIAAGATQTNATALHCDLIEAEPAGRGTGAPGLFLTLDRPPVVAPTEDQLDLVVGIEARGAELTDRPAGREFAGKFYRTWREVDSFTQVGDDSHVYIADRMAGSLRFAPAIRSLAEDGALEEAPKALAAIPGADREIRVWYRRGAGQNGNVAAGTLTVLKDPIAGVAVTNLEPAVGGRAAETVENAVLRGPQELHSLQRAVTGRDFELVAARSGAVSRTRAFTRAALWTFAAPGSVEVVLVPFVDEAARSGRIAVETMTALQTEQARTQIQTALDERRPLGTACIVSWARYKTVKVRARVVTHTEEDSATLKERIVQRLYRTISPVAAGDVPGWRFGQALRISNIYDAALSEASVSYVDQTEFVVEEVPEHDVACLAADAFQPQTWYAGSGNVVYRSMDDGAGWSAAAKFPDQDVIGVAAHPELAGVVAVNTQNSGGQPGAQIHVSLNCGETWQERARTTYNVENMAWTVHDGAPVLVMATDVGLYELPVLSEAAPVQIFVRPGDEAVGYYSVAVAKTVRGGVSVAVAARNSGGVFLSSEGGKGNSFRNIGLAGDDVRVLAVQKDGARSFLWAAIAAPAAGDLGKGCKAWELLGAEDPADGWQTFNKDWLGGSCTNLGFAGAKILAGTYDGGVLQLAERSDRSSWKAPDVRSRLPLATRQHPFERIDAMAINPSGSVLLVGCTSGTYCSLDGGDTYRPSSSTVFGDKVTLPPNWLFCSGEHEIEVKAESETGTD